MAVINTGMRKSIKVMAVACQTSQFISLMPKPKDFVTRIVGDVVLLSSKVQKLSDDINDLLDSYADIPTNYLMTQVNTLTSSLNGVINRVNTYTQNGINQVMSVGENTMSTISEITGTAIDVVDSTTQAVESLGMTIAQSSSALLGDIDLAEDIKDATDVILEWTDNGFQTISSSVTDPVNSVTQAITDTKTKLTNGVNETLTTATTSVTDAQKWVESLLTELKEKMDTLSVKLDGGFKDVTGVSSISKGASFVTEALAESGNDSTASQAVSEIATSLSTVLENFSISKVIKAFAGVITQSVIVKLGLDQLPPIDFESMLGKIRSEITYTNEDLYNELNAAVNDIDEFNKVLQEAKDREYDDKNYKEFVNQFTEDMKKKREAIRLSMKYKEKLTSKETDAKVLAEKMEAKSALKEIEKFKKQVKKAKQTSKKSSIIGDELKNLKKEAEYCCNSIKSDWNDMMTQYNNAIKEIKEFFKNGGSGDQYIDDCCDAINKDCDEIKSLCTNLGSQLIATTIKVAMPSDLGAVVPNPAYKIADFWMDIKTIFKFIKDLITLIIDILNNINKLARIMLNGVNNLQEIIDQLMEILGIKWFMDLIDSIINLFGTKISDAKTLLENSLSPVYYKDTDEYYNTLEALDKLLSDDETVETSSDTYKNILTNKDRYYTITESEYYKSALSGNEEKYDKLLDELDEKGEEIVAYRSIILSQSETTSSVSELTNGTGELDFDIKFIGWKYFHPNLSHKNYNKLFTKIKNKIMTRAYKRNSTTRGGIKLLEKKSIKKESAYDAFYWYTYYTEDLEKDCYKNDSEDKMTYIDSSIQTQNGSIVQIDGVGNVFVANSNVRSGDYVTVNGVKYKVK